MNKWENVCEMQVVKMASGNCTIQAPIHIHTRDLDTN